MPMVTAVRRKMHVQPQRRHDVLPRRGRHGPDVDRHVVKPLLHGAIRLECSGDLPLAQPFF